MKTLILFILLLSLIIVIHECGHLIAAKIFGVYCAEFSLGMGPKLFSIKGKETEYSLRLLPLGGFVSMAGDNDNALETSADPDNQIPPERSLKGIARWKRVIVMLAGIIMNFILALVIVAIILMVNGKYAVAPEAVIKDVENGSPAYNAGMKAGDKVTRIAFENGSSMKIKTFNDFSDFMLTYEGEGEVTITVERSGEKIDLKLIPEHDEQNESNPYHVGVYSNSYEVVDINILNCWKYAIIYLKEVMKLMITTVIGLFRGIGLNNLSGPVGIYNATSQAAEMGFMTYLNLIAILSLNVGIVNALPLPILDGGRVLILIIEMIIGRPISKKAENIAMTISMLLLIMLMVFATYQDIARLITG